MSRQVVGESPFLTVFLSISSMNPALGPGSGHTVGCRPVFIAIPDRSWRRGDIDTGSGGFSIHFRVVASINAGVIVVARDQKSKVTEIRIVIWGKADGRSLGKDFSAIINVDGIRQLIACARLNQRIQVHHRPAVLPHKCVKEGLARGRAAHNLAS
jgi:hypothetical protein